MSGVQPRSRSDLLVPPQSNVHPDVQAFRAAQARAHANDPDSCTTKWSRKRKLREENETRAHPPQSYVNGGRELSQSTVHRISNLHRSLVKSPNHHTQLLPPSLPSWNENDNVAQPTPTDRRGHMSPTPSADSTTPTARSRTANPQTFFYPFVS